MKKIRELNLLSATEIIGKIKQGKLRAVELVEACIDRIEELEPKVRAWAYFDKAKAIKQAEFVDEKIKGKKALGALCGIPVGMKDIFNTSDMATCMGSPIWKNFTPGNDARVVTYIRWADGIIAGKTVTAEFAVHHPGPTTNPHNFKHTPGTSSSGSAAAVASFMVPLSVGTQTAGSTIRPASYCGIYGFKPSFGLIPRTGILKTLDTLDHVSFFSRSIEDLYLLFNVLRVKGPNYPFINKYLDNFSRKKRIKNTPWKVAFVKTSAWDHASKYAQDAIINYVSKLSRKRCLIVNEKDLPRDFNSAHDVHELIYTKALSYYFKDEYEKERGKVSKMFCKMVEKGKKIALQEYTRGLEKQNALIHELDRFFRDYDIIMTLSAAGEAPRGLYARDKKDSCLIWTLCHVPALSLPVFKGPNALPFGLQIISKRYRDYDLLNFAQVLEKGKVF